MSHAISIAQERLRKRVFNKLTKRIEIDQTVYHGSPIIGMEAIRQCKRLLPQEHGELPGEWLSVSVNDNMLQSFADGDGATGFEAHPKLSCLQLDPMHYSLACAGKVGDCEDLKLFETEASRLGYLDRYDVPFMEEADFLRLIPAWCDGLIFPWSKICPHAGFHYGQWNEEAEIALTQKGCDKVWAAINTIYVDHADLKPALGWSRIKRLARKMHTHEAA